MNSILGAVQPLLNNIFLGHFNTNSVQRGEKSDDPSKILSHHYWRQAGTRTPSPDKLLLDHL